MHNAAYLQIGYDEDWFHEGPEEEYGSRFDVAFLGARYHDRQWSSLPGHESALRSVVVEKMRSTFQDRFGLFGSGWGGGIPYLPQPEGGEVYRKAHLSLSISLCSFLERYTSDRLFRALASGTPTLLKTFDDWESGQSHEIALNIFEEMRQNALVYLIQG